MKTKALILALMAFLPLLALAQAGRFDTTLNTTNTVNGVKYLTPMSGATVQVCTAPANATPCTNYATTYTDSTAVTACSGLNGCSNPITADSNGNFGLWATPGQYQYTYTYLGQSFGPYSVTLAFNGPYGASTPPFTNSALWSLSELNANGVNFAGEFQYDQGGAAHYQANALTVGINVPNTANVTNIDGISSFVTTAANSSTRTNNNAVAMYQHCRVTGSNGACWGDNPVVDDSLGITGANLIGSEIDMSVSGASTSSFVRGLTLVGCGTCTTGAAGTAPFDSIGMEVRGLGGFVWSTGIEVDRGASGLNGILLDGLSSSNNTGSSGIGFRGYDSGGTAHQSSIEGTANGSLQLQPATGSAVFVGTNGAVTGATLTGASTGNSVTLLNAQGPTTAQTGTGAAANLYTYTLPANTVVSGKGIRVSCGGVHNSGTANPTVQVTLNGQVIQSGAIGTVSSQAFSFQSAILYTSATTSSRMGMFTSASALSPDAGTNGSLAWASNQTIACTFNVANTDQVTGTAFLVEQIQ